MLLKYLITYIWAMLGKHIGKQSIHRALGNDSPTDGILKLQSGMAILDHNFANDCDTMCRLKKRSLQ